GNYGPQIDELEPLLQVAGLRPGLRYQLHILIATSPWSRGFSPEVSIGSPEGLGVGGNYRDKDYWMPDDRWELGGRVAAGMRQHLDTPGSRPVFTRALRPALTGRGDLLSLQRSDLHLESFGQATFAASVDAGVFDPSWT